MIIIEIIFCLDYINDIKEIVEEYLYSLKGGQINFKDTSRLIVQSDARRDEGFLIALATAFVAPMDCYIFRRFETKSSTSEASCSTYTWAQMMLGSSEPYDIEAVEEGVVSVLESYGEGQYPHFCSETACSHSQLCSCCNCVLLTGTNPNFSFSNSIQVK